MATIGIGLTPPTTRPRFVLLLLVLTVSGLLVSSAGATAAVKRHILDRPSLAQISGGPALIPDATLRRAITPGDFWGGTFTASTGEHVTIFISRSYPVDQAAGQRWADFVASLVHGSELSSVVIYLATPQEINDLCGGVDILGCYGDDRLIAPGEDTSDIPAESVITHEYGHHIAEHRSNAPWAAVAWGTKRWASYENVCKRARKHELFPGAENALLYVFNPGEVFAETYRVLNERRAGLPEAPWQVVDRSLYPDATGLALVQQDVLDPWTSNHTTTLNGTFTRRGSSSVRTFRVATPYDGLLTTSLAAATGERLRVNVHTTTVCGTRSVTLRVTRTQGSGPFTLTVSLP